MDVALLSPCFWPEVRRGGERFTRELADGLIARGERPSLITSHRGLPRRDVEDGLPILRLPRPPQGRLLRRHYELYLTHVPLSYGALRAGSYDVAHAMFPTDALAAARWAAVRNRPAVLSYLGIPDRTGLLERRRRLEILQACLTGCDAVVALSEYARRAFEHWLGYEARVIAPGVDLATFVPGPPRHVRPTIICSADSGIERKHVGLLGDAFTIVRRDIPDARLVLSAPHDGVPWTAPGVEWVDLDDRDVLARANAEAWVAALPASDEAFGLVLLEALACGTPVVGYDDAAIPEVVDSPAVGRLFSELEADALAEALLSALELSAEPGTAAACRARAERFSSQATADRYLDLYRELAARRG